MTEQYPQKNKANYFLA